MSNYVLIIKVLASSAGISARLLLFKSNYSMQFLQQEIFHQAIYVREQNLSL